MDLTLPLARACTACLQRFNQFLEDEPEDPDNFNDKTSNPAPNGNHDNGGDIETGQVRTEDPRPPFQKSWVFKYGIQALSVVTFIVAATTSYLMNSFLVDFSSWGTLLLTPVVFWQKLLLQRLGGGMREQINLMRQKVNQLTTQNQVLISSNNTMEGQVSQLQHVDKELKDYAEKAGGQVDRLMQVVKENGEIQTQMKALLNREIVLHLMGALVESDKNSDYILNKLEVRMLEVRLKNIPGVLFHPDRFQAFLASDEGVLTLGDCVKIVLQLNDTNVANEQRIFEYNTQDIAKASPTS